MMATPAKPRSPAMIASIKKVKTQDNMVRLLFDLQYSILPLGTQMRVKKYHDHFFKKCDFSVAYDEKHSFIVT